MNAHTVNPTEALTRCADLSREADEARVTCHVCLERVDDRITIAATDGAVAFRYDFDVNDFPVEHWLHSAATGHAPGRAFPQWGSAHWGAAILDGALCFTAQSKTGKPRAKQPPPVKLVQGVGPLLSSWPLLTRQPNPVTIDLSDGLLVTCIEALDVDAVAGLRSEGCGLILTAGPSLSGQYWRADLSTPAPSFVERFVSVHVLWAALDVHEPAQLIISQDDDRAPLLFVSPAHTAVAMPTHRLSKT